MENRNLGTQLVLLKRAFHSHNQPKKDFSLSLSGIRKVDETLTLSMEIYSADNT